MSVRIFKLMSGEIVVGKLIAATSKQTFKSATRFIGPGDVDAVNTLTEVDLETIKLLETVNFTIENPFTLQMSQQGLGVLPLLPWCDPKKTPHASFSSSAVMMETATEDALSAHANFIAVYKRTVSPIQLV